MSERIPMTLSGWCQWGEAHETCARVFSGKCGCWCHRGEE